MGEKATVWERSGSIASHNFSIIGNKAVNSDWKLAFIAMEKTKWRLISGKWFFQKGVPFSGDKSPLVTL